jgi:hypothetical protein
MQHGSAPVLCWRTRPPSIVYLYICRRCWYSHSRKDAVALSLCSESVKTRVAPRLDRMKQCCGPCVVS